MSFLYLVSNGALNWGPVKRVLPAATRRTTRSSIVRVGGPRGRASTRPHEAGRWALRTSITIS